DDQVEVAGRISLAALPGQPDPVAVRDPFGDGHGNGPAAVEGDPSAAAVVGLLDGELELGLLVGARPLDPEPATPAARPGLEDAAEEVLEVDPLGAHANAGPWCTAAGRPGPGPRLRIDVLRYLPEVRSEGVVTSPRLGVVQYGVGLGDVLEA